MECVGDGAYGRVWKAKNRQTGEWMAIKVMKERYASKEEAMSDPELVALRKLRHPNVVRLVDAFFETDGRSSNGELWLVMEYLDMNLLEYLRRRNGKPLPLPVVQNMARKMLQALAELHRMGLVHRDLKPENILVEPKRNILKLADFGLARMATQRAPMTGYVATRWYRAPEILLHMEHYGSQVDMFSMGCIVAEMLLLEPLFPGKTELDQISKISCVLGPLTTQKSPDGAAKLRRMGFQPTLVQEGADLLRIPSDARSLVLALCTWNPKSRATASQALNHSFLVSPVAESKRSEFDLKPSYVPMKQGRMNLSKTDGKQQTSILQIRSMPVQSLACWREK